MKICAFKAFAFGLKEFFKHPLFFIVNFIIGKIILICGVFLALLISFPFFINLIELVQKLFFQGQEFLTQATFKRAIVVVKQFIAAFTDLKTIFAEIVASKYLFLFFILGVFLFIICVKIFYDYMILGWTKLSLEYYAKKHKSIELFFNRPVIWLKYIIATSLSVVVFFLPSIIYLWVYLLVSYFTPVSDKTMYIAYGFSVLVSIYFTMRLWFYPYFLLDQEASAVEALRMSYNLKYGFANLLILFVLFEIILAAPTYYMIYFPSVLTYCIFGVCVAIVWMSSWKSYAYIYKNLIS